MLAQPSSLLRFHFYCDYYVLGLTVLAGYRMSWKGLSLSVCVCIPHVFRYSRRPEEGVIQSHETGLTGDCGLSDLAARNPGPPEEQQVFLTFEPFLQPLG